MKKLLVLIFASMTSSLVMYALVSKDQPARHSGLKAASLPPLISVHDLYPVSNLSPENATPFGSGTTVALQQTEGSAGSFGPQLSLPQTNSTAGPLPAVVLIDSGSPGPDIAQTVRLLVNRGYAVLSIDCRNDIDTGSIATGPGSASAGGCTQLSIADHARDLVKQGIADPAALAISGSGTGATLALMTMSIDPGLFQAAVVYSPAVPEPDHLYTSAVPRAPKQEEATTGLHPIVSNEHPAELADKSPIHLISSVAGAVLMIHGDTVAAAEIDPAAARALVASRNNVEIYRVGLEDHTYSGWQTSVQVARLTETFLARHLGGRNGGYDYIELLAKLF